MNTWLTTQIGAEAANIVSYVALFIAAIIVLWLIILIVKRFNKGTYVVGGKNRQPRLSVRDAAPIDNKRQLVLIKRDNIEHLILIGGPTDLVIERNITNSLIQSNEPVNMLNIDSLDSEQSHAISTLLSTSNDVPDQNNVKVASDDGLNATNNIAQPSPTLSNTQPPKARLKDNDQTIFANLAINKATTKKAVNSAPSNSAKAMNDANYKGIAFENIAISASEDLPIEKNDITDIRETSTHDASEYIAFDETQDSLKHDLNIESEARNEEEINQSELTDQGLELSPSEEYDLSAEQAPQAISTEILQANQSNASISSPTSSDDIPEKLLSPIAVGKAEISNDTATNVSETLLKIKAATPNNGTQHTSLSDEQALINSQPTEPAKTNIASVNIDSVKSETPVRPDAAQKQRIQNQSNPFGKPKPINPYKVMKAVGAFSGINKNVNFGTSIANAPANKSSNLAGENQAKVNNADQGSQQPNIVEQTAFTSKADTPSNGTTLTNNVTGSASVTQSTSNIVNTVNIPHDVAQSNINNTATVSANNEQSGNLLGSQNGKDDLTATQHNSAFEMSGSGKAVSQNIANPPRTENERAKAAAPIGKSLANQERPVAQRTVPQGMLRPPLMAKPRNVATTASNSQPINPTATVKVEDTPSKPADNMDTSNIGSKNAIGLQSIKTAKESSSQSAIINSGAQVEVEKTTVEAATVNKVSAEKTSAAKEPVKATPQNKIGSLQKFSLQLLEPQHILDKPNRQDDNIEEAKATSGRIPTAREEEEFDRHLQNELGQPTKK